MFLGLNFVNISTIIAHVGNYLRLFSICAIISLISFALGVIYSSDHNLTVIGKKKTLTIPKLSLLYNFLYCNVVEEATNIASMVHKTIQLYFLLLHEMVPLLSKNVHPDVNLHASRSHTKLASG